MNSSFTEDESIDSEGEDYDPEEYKLQDIAAIVLGSGDVKQVCINRVTSDNENDSFEQPLDQCNENETSSNVVCDDRVVSDSENSSEQQFDPCTVNEISNDVVCNDRVVFDNENSSEQTFDPCAVMCNDRVVSGNENDVSEAQFDPCTINVTSSDVACSNPVVFDYEDNSPELPFDPYTANENSRDINHAYSNQITSDSETDNFEQPPEPCIADEIPETDSSSAIINNLDASENNQELVNGNDEELEKAPTVENLYEAGAIDPSLDSINVETNFTPEDQCSSPNTSPSRLTSYNMNDTLRSSSLSPIRLEKSPENSELIESTADSMDTSTTDADCILKVLDEVKESPNSSESHSELRTEIATPILDDESNEQTQPLDGDNYNLFCDRENLEKIFQCDNTNDGDCTPREGSTTPILCSPSSQDLAAESKNCTFDNGAERWKEDVKEIREEPTQKENGFESANELWKEDEENLNSSFSNIDIPLPPSENRANEKESKRWKINRWSSSKREDRDRDRSESWRDRSRRDRRDSSRDGRSSKRSHHRDSSDEKRSKDSRSRKSDSDRSSRRRRTSRRRSTNRSPNDYKRDDHRRSESSRWSRRGRSRDRSSTYDRHRSSRHDRRSDKYSKDKRSKSDRYSSSETRETSSRKHDSSKSKKDYKSSRKHSCSSNGSSDGSRSRKTNDSDKRAHESDRKSKNSDRRSERSDRRSKDSSRRYKHSDRRHNDSGRRSPDADRRHDDSNRKSPDDRPRDDSGRKTPDADRRHNNSGRKTPEFDRRLNDSKRKSPEFDRRHNSSDRKSHDFNRRHLSSDRKSKDRRHNESYRKSYENERQWQDDRFELNKNIEMPNPFEEENWDEEAAGESYYKRPPEPKSPPPPEPDYPPPEPNYPPPESDYPPEPDYSPVGRPPSPAEEPMTSPPRFEPILENEYRTERCVSKDAERMICDCILTKEEISRGEKGCGEDCLNRLLLIECCSRCLLGERCSNKSFQKREYPNCEIFKTKKKGHGLRTLQDVPSGTFIMEYVGEVLDSYEFEKRAMEYARGKSPHFYFMSLKSDSIIDATVKGNISRFINHSCEPNTETQKWTVQGELRIGFFSLRDIKAGEEITFDYQLQRYGKQAQRCYCEAPSCNGWIGDDPDKYVNDDRHFKDWETALDEISQVGLMNRHQTLNLNRLMVHAKELPVRMQILQLIEEGNPPCRRLFVDYHGLPIIWSWMVDCTPEQDELKIQILKTLASLPITNKTILVDSKILSVVEQWAFMFEQKVHSSEALSAQSVLESVEDIASADETPVSELAQKLMNDWSSLREAYRIPRKERIQQMKKHEQEADQVIPKHRPKRLPVYAEQMRDRYRRNRHSRDKDFEKIYFDRMKDYNGAPSDQRKRRDSPGKNFENRKRRGDHNKEGGNGSKVSKSERRFMFEMKVKREEEEQQQNWLKLYYSQHQSQLAGMMLPAPYMTHIPPPQIFPPQTPIDPKQQQAQQQQQPSSTRTHPYYPIAPPISYPTVPTPHMQLPSTTPQATSALPPPTQYYRPPMVTPYPPPTVISYPRPIVSDQQQQPQPVPALIKPEDQYMYDYQAIRNQMPQIAPVDEATLRETLRRVETLTDRRESSSYQSSSVGQAVAEVNPAESVKLPPNWKTARDPEGRIYYYHTKTRVSQWYAPVETSRSDEDTSDGRSTGEDDDDVEFKKRRRKSSHASDKESNDMDAEIKENLAAMSSEFQDSDYEDYSPALKNNEEPSEALDKEKSTSQAENTSGPEKVPLITEHIISPREPISKEERINNKKRIRSLKEKQRKYKKAKIMNGSSTSSKGNSNGHVNSNSTKLVSAPADTSSITERKKKDAFRTAMANFVVICLNPYFHSTCAQGRITNDKDFKHLARKLTHFVMVKELKHCQSVTDLTCNSSVKHKAKEFIRKYMSKFGEVYIRPPDDANY